MKKKASVKKSKKSQQKKHLVWAIVVVILLVVPIIAVQLEIQKTEQSAALAAIQKQIITFDDIDTEEDDVSIEETYPTDTIRWQKNAWIVSSPFKRLTTNSLSYADEDTKAGKFFFVQPRRLVQFEAYNDGPGTATITVACPTQQTKQIKIASKQILPIETGWTKNCSPVTLRSSTGWDINYDNFIIDDTRMVAATPTKQVPPTVIVYPTATTMPSALPPTTKPTVKPTILPTNAPTTPQPLGMRALPDPWYGVTVDDVSNVSQIVASSKALSHIPVTRIVFDEGVAASSYVNAVNQIQPVSYIMGELLDSEGLKNSSLQQYHDRMASYLTTLGSKVDVWEIGNEVNGDWTGPYAQVGQKIYDAYQQVEKAGKRSALTLWYDDGCGNGPAELDPIAFSQQYVPADMRNGLDYVLVSYYETQCNNIRPSQATLTTFFNKLHALYPNAKLGFGEVGFPNPVGSNTAAATSMINYYYGLDITTPGYIGGYFWWYYYEDMLPHTSKPLWNVLNNALNLY